MGLLVCRSSNQVKTELLTFHHRHLSTLKFTSVWFSVEDLPGRLGTVPPRYHQINIFTSHRDTYMYIKVSDIIRENEALWEKLL